MSRFFATFFLVILIVVWYAYERAKSIQKARISSEKFWAKEAEANSTRKKSMADLTLITIPLDRLPITSTDDEKLGECQDFITFLSEKDIINLTGISNTDLKLKYGAPNFPYLSECDQNFTDLVRTLNQWAERLLELKRPEDARQVLEFAVSCRSDVSTTYQMLSSLYVQSKDSKKILELIKTAETLDTLLKENILANLEKAYIASGSGFDDIFTTP